MWQECKVNCRSAIYHDAGFPSFVKRGQGRFYRRRRPRLLLQSYPINVFKSLLTSLYKREGPGLEVIC